MDDEHRIRKKRMDVKVHYIRRDYNSNIVSCLPCEQKENKAVYVGKKR